MSADDDNLQLEDLEDEGEEVDYDFNLEDEDLGALEAFLFHDNNECSPLKWGLSADIFLPYYRGRGVSARGQGW